MGDGMRVPIGCGCWCGLWAMSLACTAPLPVEPDGEPGFESSDDVVLGDEVVCETPVDGFDRLAPVAEERGVVHAFSGALTMRLGQAGVVARDLDGDGDIDLSVGAQRGDVPIWANDGHGHFEPVPSPPSLERIVMRHAAVDLTGDGLPELIFAGAGHVTWRENLGDLSWGPAIEAWRGNQDHIAAAFALGDADRDGDGDADLFVASHRDFGPTPPNSFYRNDGSVDDWATLVEDGAEIGWAQIFSPMGIDAADLNGDEELDYCITDTGAIKCFLSAGGFWAEGAAEMGLVPPGNLPGDWSGWSLDLVDLDVDGFLDVGVVAAFADISSSEGPDQPDGHA